MWRITTDECKNGWMFSLFEWTSRSQWSQWGHGRKVASCHNWPTLHDIAGQVSYTVIISYLYSKCYKELWDTVANSQSVRFYPLLEMVWRRTLRHMNRGLWRRSRRCWRQGRKQARRNCGEVEGRYTLWPTLTQFTPHSSQKYIKKCRKKRIAQIVLNPMWVNKKMGLGPGRSSPLFWGSSSINWLSLGRVV